MNSLIPQQNLTGRVTALSFAPGANFATAVALRRMATANGVTPFYLLAPEIAALLHYMPDRRHHFFFNTLWNTGARIGEGCTLIPESFIIDGPRPFVRILSEKVRSRRGRPLKDAVRLVPLTDPVYVRQVEVWMASEKPRRRAADDGVHFSVPVTPHTFRHSYIMHLLYHRQPLKVIQALAGHKDARSIEVYTRVFALDMAATLEVSFSGEGAEAAAVLRSLPPELKR